MPIWRREHELARVAVHYFGIIITAISVTALMGKIGHQANLDGWMSLPVALCLILAGIGFYLVSRGEATHGEGA